MLDEDVSFRAKDLLAPLSFFIEQSEISSFDWWDMWATKLGRWAKRTYSKNKFMGSTIVGPLLLLDLIYPNFRKFFSETRAFPICHAQVGLGYLHLFECTKDSVYLEKAKSIVEPLLQMASPYAKGLGWGIKLDWTTMNSSVPSDTPCNTQTAYSYDFFSSFLRITGEERYREYLSDIARHVAYDFPEWKIGDTLVCSYSTIDDRKVANANSYRMTMLIDAGRRFGNPEYLEKGLATLRYVLSVQREDGAWYYAEDQPFIDHYHTCFVLKNLCRTKKMLGDNIPVLELAIEQGLSYYFDNLFEKGGYPIPFAVKPRLTLHKYDSYDLAESIGLLAELNIEHGRLFRLLELARKFQTQEGWFRFRIYPFFSSHGIPYLRYANAAMFLALTKVLLLCNRKI